MNLKLERLELREIQLPLKYPFETSFGRTTRRRIMILRVFDSSGAIGYGESTAPEDPFFNHETIETAWHIITEFAAPLIAQAKIEKASDVSKALAPIRGNRMAIGGVETAIWELQSRIAGLPLWQHLGGTQNEIMSGVSIGLQESIDALLEKVTLEVSRGYQRIKLKIKPGQDIDLVEAVREKFPDIKLTVDANSAYRLEDADTIKKLDQYNLLLIEQPLQAGDLVDHAKLQRELKTPVCLDESITTLTDARQAHELGSCRIINIKLCRVGGHSEASRIQKFASENGMPVWCGGMLESGIGRAHNIAMSTQPGFVLPGDVSASSRYWEEDVIDPPVTVSSSGTIEAPMNPGIGFEVKESLIESLTVRRQEVTLR